MVRDKNLIIHHFDLLVSDGVKINPNLSVRIKRKIKKQLNEMT